MSNHTPGPWVHYEKLGESADAVVALNSETGIAKLLGHKAVRKANARLIAAAPDLLETLQGIMCVIYNTCDRDEYAKLIKEMQSAIEKATGEST